MKSREVIFSTMVIAIMMVFAACKHHHAQSPTDRERIIQIGTFKSVESLQQALKEKGSYTEDDTTLYRFFRDNNITFSKKVEEIDLAIVSLKNLGLDNYDDSISLKKLISAAAKQGLLPCPVEAAFQLRLQFLDQPNNWFLTVITEEKTEDGKYFTFSLRAKSEDVQPNKSEDIKPTWYFSLSDMSNFKVYTDELERYLVFYRPSK